MELHMSLFEKWELEIASAVRSFIYMASKYQFLSIKSIIYINHLHLVHYLLYFITEK